MSTHVWVIALLNPDDRVMWPEVSEPMTEPEALAAYWRALMMLGAEAGSGETVTVRRGDAVAQVGVIELAGRTPLEAADAWAQDAARILRNLGIDAQVGRR